MQRFGPWLPDQPDYENPGAKEALNVLPRTEQSYGPIGGLTSVSDALADTPKGAATFRDSAGNTETFAATASDLYQLSVTSWTEVSKSTGAYTVAADDITEFAQFGQVVISVNGHTDAPQAFTLNSSSAFADLGGSPPRARHIAIIEPGFVMLGNTWDSSDRSVPNRVWWSALNDATDWPTIGSADAAAKQSDYQDLPVGGWVQRITGAIGGLDGAIFMEKAIYRIQYQGPPTVFGFYEVERDRGTPAPNSVVNVGPFGFYLGEEGFYSFSGSGSTPIGDQKVDKTFFNDLDANYYNRIYGAADPINKMVWWAYPGSGNSNGRPNKVVIYNWAIDRWSNAEVEQEFLFKDLSDGYTLDQLDQFGNLDTLPFSLDSRVWTGGRLLLSGFDSSNKLARFAGDNLAATIETTEGALLDGNARAFVNGVQPFTDAVDSDVTVALKFREGNSSGSTLTLTSANAIDADGFAHFTTSTKFASAQVNIAAGASWTHAQGVTYDAVEDGGQ